MIFVRKARGSDARSRAIIRRAAETRELRGAGGVVTLPHADFFGTSPFASLSLSALSSSSAYLEKVHIGQAARRNSASYCAHPQEQFLHAFLPTLLGPHSGRSGLAAISSCREEDCCQRKSVPTVAVRIVGLRKKVVLVDHLMDRQAKHVSNSASQHRFSLPDDRKIVAVILSEETKLLAHFTLRVTALKPWNHTVVRAFGNRCATNTC